MNNRKILKTIKDDFIGTIILIIDEEKEFKGNLKEFFEESKDFYCEEYNVKKEDLNFNNIRLSMSIIDLIAEGFSIDIIDDKGNRFNQSSMHIIDGLINAYDLIDRDIVIYK